jgi:hypothetical protein
LASLRVLKTAARVTSAHSWGPDDLSQDQEEDGDQRRQRDNDEKTRRAGIRRADSSPRWVSQGPTEEALKPAGWRLIFSIV